MRSETALTHWTAVELWEPGGEACGTYAAPRGPSTDTEHNRAHIRRALAEYSRTGGTGGSFLNEECTPEGGLEVSDIDWTGIDARDGAA